MDAKTATAMFWTAYDTFRKRMREHDTDGGRRALFDMTQAYPDTDDNDLNGNRTIVRCALELDKALPQFNILYFLPWINRLTDDDWKAVSANGHYLPSLGQRTTNRLMADLRNRSDEYISKVMPFFRRALQINPSNKENLRHLAQLYNRVKLRTQAINIYQRLLLRYHDSYLYAELAQILTDRNSKIALLCVAVKNQRKEVYNVKYRFQLAELLREVAPRRAAYEIRKSIAVRMSNNMPIPSEVARIDRLLSQEIPVTEDEEQRFYNRASYWVSKELNRNK